MLTVDVSTSPVILPALISGLGTAVVVIAADQLRRWSGGVSEQIDKLDKRLGERLDATDARVDDVEDVTTAHGERLAALETVAGWPARPSIRGRRRL